MGGECIFFENMTYSFFRDDNHNVVVVRNSSKVVSRSQ